jgi:gliding motility-associated-like protein
MKPTLNFAEDTAIYRPSDIDLGADVNRRGIISTKTINTTEFLDNPETFKTYAKGVSHSISYIGSIITDSSQGGCIVVDTFNITFIDSVWGPYLPTAFTPNGDDKNDVFYVRMGGEFRVNLIIYDRWEKVIFTSTDKLDGWDGTYNGKDMGAGIYAYVVYGSYLDYSEFIKKGKVSLVR